MRIAVFIDAENMPVETYSLTARRLEQSGRIIMARAVGDFCAAHMTPWREQAPSLGIDLDLQPSCGKAKNTADIALAAEAMEAALSGRFDAIAILSGDGDFTPLAMRVRRRGLQVLGFAFQENASPHFRAACTSFAELTTKAAPPLPPAPKPAPPTPAQAKPAPPAPLQRPLTSTDRAKVQALFAQSCAQGSGITHPGQFGSLLRRTHPDVADKMGKGKLLKCLLAEGIAVLSGAAPNTRLRLPK